MNKIVKYHNDLNKINLPRFNELQNNLLFGIIQKVCDKGNEKIEFKAHELNEFVKDKKYTNKELFNEICHLRSNFFKADFTILVKGKEINEVGIETINLFKTFAIYYVETEKKDFSQFTRIELEVNSQFAYLINELVSNFTRFELAEFIALTGKYAKTLYRLLKQYRKTGLMRMEWEEFKRIMDIPNTYKMCEIERQILKPAINQLKEERTLLDQQRIPFRKLEYKKIKDKKGRGQGGKVVGIEFYFMPETNDETETKRAETSLNTIAWDIQKESKIKSLKQSQTTNTANKDINDYKGRHIELYDNKYNRCNTLKILDLEVLDSGIIAHLYNSDDDYENTMKFESWEHFVNFFENNKI